MAPSPTWTSPTTSGSARPARTSAWTHARRKGITTPVAYWHVEDIDRSLAELLAAGAQADQDVKDVGGGKLVASVKDPDGNVVGLIQEPRS